jgi:hypothetical protein
MQKRDPGIAIWIILDRGHFCRNIMFIPTKINETITAFVTAASTTASNYTAIIPSFTTMFMFGQPLFGFRAGNFRKI